MLHILSDIDLTLDSAQTLAVVGASGSGKSTLLSILAGLDTPTSGKVVLNGVDIFSMSEDERAAWRAKHLGFVFQSFQLLHNLSALENVMLPLELQGDPAAREKATEMLSKVGLKDRLNHYPKVLSGGEQQRVAIARAFVVQPRLLFADEPTGSLDHATGKLIMDMLFEMNQAAATTLVLVTHDDRLAERCQHQLRITEGRSTGMTSKSEATNG
jgi:putative ABC transport system ATP-binding protein